MVDVVVVVLVVIEILNVIVVVAVAVVAETLNVVVVQELVAVEYRQQYPLLLLLSSYTRSAPRSRVP